MAWYACKYINHKYKRITKKSMQFITVRINYFYCWVKKGFFASKGYAIFQFSMEICCVKVAPKKVYFFQIKIWFLFHKRKEELRDWKNFVMQKIYNEMLFFVFISLFNFFILSTQDTTICLKNLPLHCFFIFRLM